MNIKVLDSWLREYVETKATAQKIAEYLSLCGPSVEKVEKINNDFIYEIEITTNRIDSASVYGIAREASAILPRFGIPAKLKKIEYDQDHKFTDKVSYLDAQINRNLCPRFSAVLIKDVKIGESPDFIKNRLEASGVRVLNNVIDISNYIMIAIGQPVHTFDYDKISNATMILRESKKGEKITTLDDKEFTLPGGDIVIEDGEGRLIDLAGVMGGKLSAVDENTKNVLLFVQTYNPNNIRKTSMALAQRTLAATIFEKGIDSELVTQGILMGIVLFEKNTGGKAEREIINIYPTPYKTKNIKVTHEKITKLLGLEITKGEVTKILKSLDLEPIWKGNELVITVPSFRSNDISLPEDVVEEIARIYGYHNLPSEIMKGALPNEAPLTNFNFESEVKKTLEGWGGVEVYTLSLVPKSFVNSKALKLKNPLGDDAEYLRTSLLPSLTRAAKENIGTFPKFHLFEMSNVYLPINGNLPNENLVLGGIFEGYSYRDAKGIVEAFLEKIGVIHTFKPEDMIGLTAGRSLFVSVDNKNIGFLGFVENTDFIYYEFNMIELQSSTPSTRKYKDISKYPVQIEDITFTLPNKTKVGEVIDTIYDVNKLITKVDLKDVYKNNYTFNIEYHDSAKTLSDVEVEKVRNSVITTIKSKFGGTVEN